MEVLWIHVAGDSASNQLLWCHSQMHSRMHGLNKKGPSSQIRLLEVDLKYLPIVFRVSYILIHITYLLEGLPRKHVYNVAIVR